MKHPFSIVVILLALFLSAQYIGLFVVSNYVDARASAEAGEVVYKELPAGIERPDIEPQYSFVFISIAVIIGTLILLLIMKFRVFNLWKAWYFLAVTLSLAIAWAAFIPQMFAGIAALIASAWKVFRPNVIIHNITELFIYSGLAAIFVPILNVFSAAILLLIISAYDMYAVWRSKHMVGMAKFQMQSNIFAGLSIPKGKPSAKIAASKPAKKLPRKGSEDRIAIIGGGDIGFPLLFAGAAMTQYGQAALVIPFFSFLGLASLFYISKKGKFYPAMPFISVGCFVGFGIMLLLP